MSPLKGDISYEEKGKERGWGGHSLEPFAEAVRTPSCQDCSKASAAEVDTMQHMLGESYHLHIPGEPVIFIIRRMLVSSVVKRKQKNKSCWNTTISVEVTLAMHNKKKKPKRFH